MIRTSTKGLGCFLFIVLFWNGIVGFFDYQLGAQYFDQLNARRNYTPVLGTVTDARVDEQHSDEGTQYKPVIEYDYTHQGTTYSADRYSFYEFSTSSSRFAKDVVAQHPPGTTVQVWIDPNDPTESVLDISDDSFPYTVILFMIPFHCVGIGFLVWFLGAVRDRNTPELELKARPLIASRSNTRLVLRDQAWNLWTVYLTNLCVSSFILTFVVLLIFGGFMADRRVVLFACLLSCVYAAVIMTRTAVKRTNPARRIIIDFDTQTFSRADGSESHPIAAVTKIDIESEPKFKSKKKPNKESWHTHEFIAVLDTGARIPLVHSQGHKDQRRELKPWFESIFGLSDPTPRPAPEASAEPA